MSARTGITGRRLAIAPDYVQKLWPNNYANRRKHYDFEGERAGQFAAGGLYLDQCARRRADRAQLRLLGGEQEAAAGPDGVQIEKVNDPVADPRITNMHYRSFDLDYPDVERAKAFLGRPEAVRSQLARCRV